VPCGLGGLSPILCVRDVGRNWGGVRWVGLDWEQKERNTYKENNDSDSSNVTRPNSTGSKSAPTSRFARAGIKNDLALCSRRSSSASKSRPLSWPLSPGSATRPSCGRDEDGGADIKGIGDDLGKCLTPRGDSCKSEARASSCSGFSASSRARFSSGASRGEGETMC
jgi:hypothetical protein